MFLLKKKKVTYVKIITTTKQTSGDGSLPWAGDGFAFLLQVIVAIKSNFFRWAEPPAQIISLATVQTKGRL